jgi:hypothetical protein
MTLWALGGLLCCRTAECEVYLAEDTRLESKRLSSSPSAPFAFLRYLETDGELADVGASTPFINLVTVDKESLSSLASSSSPSSCSLFPLGGASKGLLDPTSGDVPGLCCSSSRGSAGRGAGGDAVSVTVGESEGLVDAISWSLEC